MLVSCVCSRTFLAPCTQFPQSRPFPAITSIKWSKTNGFGDLAPVSLKSMLGIGDGNVVASFGIAISFEDGYDNHRRGCLLRAPFAMACLPCVYSRIEGRPAPWLRADLQISFFGRRTSNQRPKAPSSKQSLQKALIPPNPRSHFMSFSCGPHHSQQSHRFSR